MTTQIFAHRGASIEKPENTLEAFERAIELGADGIELDVHKTADGQLIVTHDENLRRITLQDKMIATSSYAEIAKLDAGAYRPATGSARIPLLADVLDLIKNHDILLNIEIKNAPVIYPQIEEDVLAMVQNFGLNDRVIYSSFNHYSIMKLKSLGTSSELAFLYMEPLYEAWSYAASRAVGGLHPHYGNLQIPNYMDQARANGIKIRPWTVDKGEEICGLLRLGVDGIISNEVRTALRVREKWITESRASRTSPPPSKN